MTPTGILSLYSLCLVIAGFVYQPPKLPSDDSDVKLLVLHYSCDRIIYWCISSYEYIREMSSLALIYIYIYIQII